MGNAKGREGRGNSRKKAQKRKDGLTADGVAFARSSSVVRLSRTMADKTARRATDLRGRNICSPAAAGRVYEP
jgi:hypothetical protein